MENKKIDVIYRERARKSILNFAIFIDEKGYPSTADKFIKVIMGFGNRLNLFPEKYAICRKHSLEKRKFRCATFKKNYIFIYKVVKSELVIYNVIHSSRYRD